VFTFGSRLRRHRVEAPQPIIGHDPDLNGGGYARARDGGVFTFGSAFRGSRQHARRRSSGSAGTSTESYWLTARQSRSTFGGGAGGAYKKLGSLRGLIQIRRAGKAAALAAAR
jgi:hypothetical protein